MSVDFSGLGSSYFYLVTSKACLVEDVPSTQKQEFDVRSQ